MRNDIQLEAIERLIGHIFSENFILLCIKNQLPVRHEHSYTILSLRKGFLYRLGL